jgi:predicted nicotinamide N-methyase
MINALLSAEARFILHNTAPGEPPLLPGLRLHLASEVTPLWEATEETLARSNLPPPYWAFAWPGGQAVARYLLDRPDLVRGRRVLDFASGSGLVAIAAARAGAAHVTANEIDAFAAAAIGMNAGLNGLPEGVPEIAAFDLMGRPMPGIDIVLAGDVCYERPMAERAIAWFTDLARSGAEVILGDPGRAYLPREGLEPLARYDVPTPLDLEDREVRETTVWRLKA